MLGTIHREPRAFGIPGTRWTLAKLRAVAEWLGQITPASVARLLDRLGVSWKRGRESVTSPDPDYLAKVAQEAVLVQYGQATRGQVVTLYLDEITYYRRPTVAAAWAACGPEQPRAEQGYAANTATRVLAALDVRDGRVHAWQGSKVSLDCLVRFYRRLRAAYPTAARIYVLQDNWPIHFHPDVLAALEPQISPWPRRVPANWPTEPSSAARRRWSTLQLPIQLVPLPTYAPWTNPIEKLWRWLRQDVLHLHRLARDLPALRAQVLAFLDQFAAGSAELLRYVGLASGLPPFLASALPPLPDRPLARSLSLTLSF